MRYEADGLALHGPGGLGGVSFPSATRHTLHPADKVLCELAHENPREVTVVNLGPLTTLATALDRDPGLPAVLDQTVIVGGCWRESGNASPVAEFHILLDPDGAKRVLHAELHPLVIPLAPVYFGALGWFAVEFVRGPHRPTPSPRWITQRWFSLVGVVVLCATLAVWALRFVGFFGGPVPVQSYHSWTVAHVHK